MKGCLDQILVKDNFEHIQIFDEFSSAPFIHYSTPLALWIETFFWGSNQFDSCWTGPFRTRSRAIHLGVKS